MTNRQLVVMRHAKAGPYTETDHERPLRARGTRDACDAGDYLAEISVVPDYALVSTATRAAETWKAVAASTGCAIKPHFRDDLYSADAWEVLELLQGVPADFQQVMFVGHNPTAAELVDLLNDGEGDPEIEERLLDGYPTAALTVFDVAGAWTKLTDHSCRVTHFHVGRG
ncbi:MAG: histidine phosphatase family protein [Aeromicrobium sp.]